MSVQLDPGLIAVIRCPVTKSRLQEASASLIDRLNLEIEAGNVVNRIGQTIESRLDSGFVNADQSLLLPVRGGIITLIADESIVLSASMA